MNKSKELQDFAIWMTGCGYDFTQHEHFLKNRYLLTECCTELKVKKGNDFEEFCSEHFIHKNSNTYSKESGLPVSLNDMLQKYRDLKHSL
jgi:hypothetical protein